MLSVGCGAQSSVSTTSSNGNAGKAAAPTANAANASTTMTSSSAAGSLATPAEAYRTAHALREKKDVEGLKTVLSEEVIEFLKVMAEADKKTLDDQIREMFVKPQARQPETRNETIRGDRATIEYRDEKGGWKVMDFVQEGGVWKLSFPDKGDIEIQSAPPAR